MSEQATQNKIDVILTWVDGSDPAWLEEKERYVPSLQQGVEEQKVRYRDWDNIQYIFRGIETFMPWVNRVHFVTWGHVPAWMNTECDKLHIVNHKDFIPEEYLPTFNSNTIELNLHRIPGLAEQFVNFNDDMFVIGPTQASDFFEHGLPKDMAALSPTHIIRDVMACVEINNFGIINEHFSMEDMRRNRKKWYSFKYGKYMVRTFVFSRFHSMIGIYEPHIPFSYLKSTFLEVWEQEGKTLDAACRHKSRTRDDVNEWLFRYWQIMAGNFAPRRWDFGLLLRVGTDDERICSLLHKPGKVRLLCMNDTKAVEDFEASKRRLNASLETLFPQKSKFEK